MSVAAHIERVSRIHSSWGEEVVEVVFAGNERGLLAESIGLVTDFFMSLRGGE